MLAYQIISSANSEIEFQKLLKSIKGVKLSSRDRHFVNEAIQIGCSIQLCDF